MNQVIVSVIMPVFNTKEGFLREAIESILNQTFKDFEFIIVDDASNEQTRMVIHSYNDERIKILTNSENHGITKSLNRGLDEASGKYIARMDSDDISFPKRLEKQVDYMEKHPTIDILGSYVYDGEKIRPEYSEITQKERETLFWLENVGPIHPSVMIRKSFLDKYSLRYNEEYPVAQDYELWVRCNKLTDIHFYPEPLLMRRKHAGQVGKKNSFTQHAMAARIKTGQILPLLESMYTQEYVERIVLSLTDGGASYRELCSFLKELKKYALEKKLYDSQAMKFVITAYKIDYLRNNYSILKRRFFQVGLFVRGDISIYKEFRRMHIKIGEQ